MKYIYKVATSTQGEDNCCFENLKTAKLRFDGYKEYIMSEFSNDERCKFKILAENWDDNDHTKCYMSFSFHDATGERLDNLYINRQWMFETEEEYLAKLEADRKEDELEKEKRKIREE